MRIRLRFLSRFFFLLLLPGSALYADLEGDGLLWELFNSDESLASFLVPDIDAGRCGATYRTPFLVESSRDEISIVAETMSGSVEDGLSLSGNVKIYDANLSVFAPLAKLDRSRFLEFERGALIQSSESLLLGESGDLSLTTKKGTLQRAQYVNVSSGIRATADRIQVNGKGTLYLEKARLTACGPSDNGWAVHSKQIKIDVEENALALRGLNIRIKDFPVMYLPYVKIPSSLSTADTDEIEEGFMFPDIGYEDEVGISLAIPFKKQIRDGFDGYLVPRHLGKRGPGLGAGIDLMTQDVDFDIALDWIPKDRIYNGFMSRQDFDEFSDHSTLVNFEPVTRWMADVYLRGAYGPISTLIDYRSSSDYDYFRHFGTDFSINRNQPFEGNNPLDATQIIDVAFQEGGLNVRLLYQGFDRSNYLSQPGFIRSPQFELSYSNQIVSGVSLGFRSEIAHFRKKKYELNPFYVRPLDMDETSHGHSGKRWFLQPRLDWSDIKAHKRIKVAMGIDAVEYDGFHQFSGNSTSLQKLSHRSQTFFISTDMAYRFQKSFSLIGGNFFQTLEPRVKYFRRSGPNSDSALSLDTALLPLTIESLWRDDELVGRDRRESTDWLALGFSSRVHSLQTGKEKIEFSVGVKERFRTEETESQISTVPLTYWTKRLYGSSIRWDFGNNTGFEVSRMSGGEHESVSQTHFELEHRNGQAGLFSLAYRKGNRLSGFSPRDIEQLEFNGMFEVSRGFRPFFAINFDLDRSRLSEGFLGLEYQDCCFRLRFLAKRAIKEYTFVPFDFQADSLVDQMRNESGFSLEFTLNGIGRIGSRIDELLSSTVRGYRSVR